MNECRAEDHSVTYGDARPCGHILWLVDLEPSNKVFFLRY
jgi:hypothetical protein